MAAADVSVDDVRIGTRVINAAALNAMLVANPSALTQAAIASALAQGGFPAKFAGIVNTAGAVANGAIVAAAGATQGNAGAIPATISDVLVTVTASTEGLRLPASATNKRLTVWPSPTVGNKLYPATNQIIGAAATNAALVVVKNKPVVLIGFDLTHWRFQAGA